MSVGINGSIGKPMIHEGQGLDIFVRRSLRDVFKKVPTLSIEIKVLDFFFSIRSKNPNIYFWRQEPISKLNKFVCFLSWLPDIDRLVMTILINVIIVKG